jgi:hypothetical protein
MIGNELNAFSGRGTIPEMAGDQPGRARRVLGSSDAVSIRKGTTVTEQTPSGEIGELTEERAHELAWEAVEKAGGTRAVYRNPKYAFSLQQARDYEIDGYTVEVRHGEISSPAIVTVNGWVFEVLDEDVELLMRPVKRRTRTNNEQ